MHTVSIRYQLDRISAAAVRKADGSGDDQRDGSGQGVTKTVTPPARCAPISSGG